MWAVGNRCPGQGSLLWANFGPYFSSLCFSRWFVTTLCFLVHVDLLRFCNLGCDPISRDWWWKEKKWTSQQNILYIFRMRKKKQWKSVQNQKNNVQMNVILPTVFLIWTGLWQLGNNGRLLYLEASFICFFTIYVWDCIIQQLQDNWERTIVVQITTWLGEVQ